MANSTIVDVMVQSKIGLPLALFALTLVAPACDRPPADPTPPADSDADKPAEPPADPTPPADADAPEDPPADGGYDPCAGKACGESCTICAPDDGDCMETAVVKQCNAKGECSPEASACE